MSQYFKHEKSVHSRESAMKSSPRNSVRDRGHLLLKLQSQVGNQAVSRLVIQRGDSTAGPIAPQRIDDGFSSSRQANLSSNIADSTKNMPNGDYLQGGITSVQREREDGDYKGLFSLLSDVPFGQAAVRVLVAVGVQDQNNLTNILFWFQNPEIAFQKIDPKNRSMVRAWISIRDSYVLPVLKERETNERRPPKKAGVDVPPSEVGDTTAAKIEELISRNREEYGLSAKNEARSGNFYSKGKSSQLRAMSAENISKYASKYVEGDKNFDRSVRLFRASSLSPWKSGEDLAFVVAIATREGGGTIFRTDQEKVVSGGKDTHKKGVSGLDNLARTEYRKEYEKAGLYISEVDKSDKDLRSANRNPAWIHAQDLLFGHMLTTANHEKLFRTSYIPASAKKLSIMVDPESLWEGMSQPARRTWLGLFYSGVGHVTKTLRELIVAQKNSGELPDLNGIMTHDDFTSIPRVILSRATALRAAAFESLRS